MSCSRTAPRKCAARREDENNPCREHSESMNPSRLDAPRMERFSLFVVQAGATWHDLARAMCNVFCGLYTCKEKNRQRSGLARPVQIRSRTKKTPPPKGAKQQSARMSASAGPFNPTGDSDADTFVSTEKRKTAGQVPCFTGHMSNTIPLRCLGVTDTDWKKTATESFPLRICFCRTPGK